MTILSSPGIAVKTKLVLAKMPVIKRTNILRYLKKIRIHMLVFLKYGNLKKHMNLLYVLICYFLNKNSEKINPVILKAEISNKCHMDCLYCYQKKTNMMLPFSEYTRLLDQVYPYLYEVSLYDIGEPLHNERILEYIQYAHQRKIGTAISTSLSVERDNKFWENLVISGIDGIIVAIDGITPDIYNKYRRNGDLNLVLNNLKKILYYRRKFNSKIFIEWQMIDLRWNRHQQKAAAKLAYSMGCNYFNLICEESEIRRSYENHKSIRKHSCLNVFLALVVNSKNEVRPCTTLYEGVSKGLLKQNIVGNLTHKSYREVWNGKDMSALRNKRSMNDREFCRSCKEG